jgi:hypothetical protein
MPISFEDVSNSMDENEKEAFHPGLDACNRF